MDLKFPAKIFSANIFTAKIFEAKNDFKKIKIAWVQIGLMEHTALKIINNHWNIKIYFCLEKSGGQSLNLHLNAVNFWLK